MQVDGHPELLSAGEDGFHRGVVEKDAIGLAVDHRAEEAELVNGAAKLNDGLLRRRNRQRGERPETIRAGRDGRRHPVVQSSGDGNGASRFELLHDVRQRRKHLDVDPRGIHRLQASIAQIVEFSGLPAGATAQV